MARSIEAPFRREYTFSNSGIVTPEGGIYIGDIKTIHIGISPTSAADGLIQGKIGRQGEWFVVPFTIEEGRTGPIDVSHVEYIQLNATKVAQTTTLSLFGYYDLTDDEIIEVKNTTRDFNIAKENLCVLEDIRKELKTMNKHLKEITGENYE